MKERVLIFANPIAGKGKAKRIAGVLEEALKARGYGVKVFFSKPGEAEHAHEYKGMAPEAGGIRGGGIIGGGGGLGGGGEGAVGRAVPSGGGGWGGGEVADLAYSVLIVPVGAGELM